MTEECVSPRASVHGRQNVPTGRSLYTTIILDYTKFSREKQRVLINIVSSRRVAAIIRHRVIESQSTRRHLQRLGIPTIFLRLETNCIPQLDVSA